MSDQVSEKYLPFWQLRQMRLPFTISEVNTARLCVAINAIARPNIVPGEVRYVPRIDIAIRGPHKGGPDAVGEFTLLCTRARQIRNNMLYRFIKFWSCQMIQDLRILF
jgi:hypothetical protein